MPTPKSVVKINKDGVTYESNVDACQYYLFELSRAALRDVAKLIKFKFREAYYSVFQKHTGKGGRAVTAKVFSSKNTQYPRLDIGLPNKKIPGFYAFFQEFGTKNIPKHGILNRVVQENVAEIVKIESQYLSGLNDEAQALSMIESEQDYEIEEDDA